MLGRESLSSCWIIYMYGTKLLYLLPCSLVSMWARLAWISNSHYTILPSHRTCWTLCMAWRNQFLPRECCRNWHWDYSTLRKSTVGVERNSCIFWQRSLDWYATLRLKAHKQPWVLKLCTAYPSTAEMELIIRASYGRSQARCRCHA